MLLVHDYITLWTFNLYSVWWLLQVLGGSCGSIILISDGEENEAPYIDDVIPQLQQACVRVDSLLYSEAAEDKMITLAQQTGGVAYFATDGQTSSDLLNGLLATEAQGNSPVADAAIQVSTIMFVSTHGIEGPLSRHVTCKAIIHFTRFPWILWTLWTVPQSHWTFLLTKALACLRSSCLPTSLATRWASA